MMRRLERAALALRLQHVGETRCIEGNVLPFYSLTERLIGKSEKLPRVLDSRNYFNDRHLSSSSSWQTA